ncbi:AT-rich interactive domain-containing protein 5A isoform X2 [Vanacampus margaritifer]
METAGETSPPATEVHDKCKEGSQPSLLRTPEKSFVSSLHSFMKERGSPIDRIPHLGFKQIDLWMIYKAVEKLGGYNSVTARRLWKKVYDELGGSPGSTSAATCTRRHYERLVLPYERHLKGEDDMPLPLNKPRKPYKRNSGGKIKAEWKGKSKADSEKLLSEAAGQSEAAAHPGSALWQQPQVPLTPDLYAYSHLPHGPAATPWPANISSAVGEVISPLEKKKRVAQASLRANPQGERERPSVIRRSASPAFGGHKCDSSDGSPRPLSSSSFSSRSPSPRSISSEEENNSALRSDLAPECCMQNDDKPIREMSKDPAGARKEHIREPKVASKDLTYSSTELKSDCDPTSSSAFITMLTKSTPLPRPAPIRPGHRVQHGALTNHSKPFKNISPLPLPQETFRAMSAKFAPSQQRRPHSPFYDMRDSHLRSTLQQPAFLPRMRIPPSQLPYRHVPVSAPHSALIYPYPYAVPLWGPHASYTIPAFYSQYKL